MTQDRAANLRSDRTRFNAAGFAARAVELGLVALLSWLAAQALWFAIYGANALNLQIDPPDSVTLAIQGEAGSGIGAQGLFSTPEGSLPAMVAEAPETRLNLTLRGVRSGVDGDGGSAVIETPDRGQRSVVVGGEIASGVRLDTVFEDRVIINRNGARESLYLTDAAARRDRQARLNAGRQAGEADDANDSNGDAQNGPTTGAGSALRGQPDLALAATLSREDFVYGLRLEPAVQGGAMTGMRVLGDTSAQILQASGLRPGDVVTALNGAALSTPQAMARAVGGLGEAERIVLTVRRSGEIVTLEAPLQ